MTPFAFIALCLIVVLVYGMFILREKWDTTCKYCGKTGNIKTKYVTTSRHIVRYAQPVWTPNKDFSPSDAQDKEPIQDEWIEEKVSIKV